jgi:hypothetical protein
VNPFALTRGKALSIFALPLLLAFVTAIGLISALLGDGIWNLLSWIALVTPVVVIAWHAASVKSDV